MGRWSFDEGGGTTAADSAGGHPLTLSGDATWTPGLSGSALKVSGTGSAWARLGTVGGAFRRVVVEDGDGRARRRAGRYGGNPVDHLHGAVDDVRA